MTPVTTSACLFKGGDPTILSTFLATFYLKVMICVRKILLNSEPMYIKVYIFIEKKLNLSRDQAVLPTTRNAVKTGKN